MANLAEGPSAMKRILPALLAFLLVIAACGSSPEDAADSEDTPTDESIVDEGDTDGEDEGDASIETGDETAPPDEEGEEEAPDGDGTEVEADECVFPSNDSDAEPTELPVDNSTKPKYDDDLAGVGEADPDLVDIATYDEGQAIADDDGKPVVERVRANPCVIFDDDNTVHQCRAAGAKNDEVEAYIRLDQYLTWDGEELQVISFGENEVATPEALAQELLLVNESRDLVAGPDYILFSNMGYGVFPADNPTSVGTYSLAAANAGPNPRRDSGRTDAQIVIADSGYIRNAPPFDFLGAVTATDFETLPNSTSNPGTAHGLMVAGVAGQRAEGTPISVLDVRDPAKKAPSPTNNSSTVELISVGSLKTRLLNDNSDAYDTTILNMSFGTYGCADPLFGAESIEPFRQFVDVQLADRYVLVASAGNNDVDEPQYPAAFDMVIGVGAIDDTVRGTACGPAWTMATSNTNCVIDPTEKPWFSNYGDWVDVWAPGTDIVTAYPEGLTYEYRVYDPQHMTSSVAHTASPGPLVRISGTSLAAPYVSAQLASLGATTAEINELVEMEDWTGLGLDIPKPTS